MKTIRFLRNPAGVGLVEVMMAVAVTGGLTLTIAKLMENASQSAKQVEAKSENTNLKGLVQDVLNNTTACKNTFGPVLTAANITTLSASTTATLTVPNIKDKLNVIRYSTASTNISPLSIVSMELTNYNALAYTGDLIINSNFKKSTNNIVMVKPIRIPINFSFTSGSLTACSTMAVGGEWLLGGNAGTVDGADYIGTSDNAPLTFKVNAQKSGRIDTTGQTYFGYQAGMNQTSNNHGTAFGFQASMYNTSGTGNSAFGWGSLFKNVSTNNNTAIGHRALFLTSTSGSNNTAIGADTLLMNTSGRGNFAGGTFSLTNNQIGSWNTAVGLNSLQYNTTGDYNSAFGAEALRNNTGSSNTASGFGAMAYFTSGSENTAIGKGAYSYATSGSSNTALGVNALYRTSGSFNTALGQEALGYNSSGQFNVALGYFAGITSTSGSNNLFLGAKSGAGSTGSNKLYIETSGATNPLIGGDFSSAGRYVVINGKLGVGTSTPGTPTAPQAIPVGNAVKLHVSGGETILDQEAWTPMVLVSGWVPCSYPGSPFPSYYRDSLGMVHLKGCVERTVSGGPFGPGLAPGLWNPPVGYRPDAHGSFVGGVLIKSGLIVGTCALYVSFTTSIGITSLTNEFKTGDACHLSGVSYRADF